MLLSAHDNGLRVGLGTASIKKIRVIRASIRDIRVPGLPPASEPAGSQNSLTPVREIRTSRCTDTLSRNPTQISSVIIAVPP